MKPIMRLESSNAPGNHIWRFYADSARQWRWEKLAFDTTVLERSKAGYKQYEDCLANARESGYVLAPSLSTKSESRSPKTKRAYVRFSSK